MTDEFERSGDDSEQTVISHSPPLEILAASTIEHQGKDLYESFTRTGMLASGTQLAHFVVTKFIGGGGMGRVYLGVDQALDRKVAIKVLPIQRAQDASSVARFMNEAKSAARLNHEHIAQVYFAGEQNSIPFIAFEYVQGTNIRTYVEEHGVLPLPQTITYLLQISHALAHAATHQVIHRDVKPSNILITSGGRAKLIDMGLARLLTHANVDNDLTASGVTLGTFDYISPEQARDPREADARSDIYSLGCTFFFMLTGRPPFPEGTVLQKLLQHQGDEPPDVRDFRRNIPPYISQIIQKMMAKDPKSRYQTASELVDDLTESAKMIGLRPVGAGSLIWQLPLKGRLQPFLRHLPWFVPLILFVILTVLVRQGFFFGTTSVVPPPLPNPASQPGIEIPPSPGNGVENGNGVSSGNGVPLIVLFPKLQSRGIREEIPPPNHSATEYNRVISASLPSQRTGAALEVESLSSGGPFVPVMAASYRASDPQSPKTGGNSPAIPDNQPWKKLIVDPTGQRVNSFKTLRDAARMAAKEATIELHFDGPIDIEYFRFAGSKITIKSGENYRPKIVFRPPASVKLTETYSMATLENSEMIFDNIEIEMAIPPNIDAIANRWTMFDLTGVNTVKLYNVILTFNNAQSDRAYQEKNAFFRCYTGTTTSPVLPLSGSPAASRTSLTFNNSLVRGEASLLRCDNSRAVEIKSNNVLIATNQPVFSLLDIKPAETLVNMITAHFNHTTIFAPVLVSWQPGTVDGTIGHSIDLKLNDSIVRFNKESPAFAVYDGGIAKLSDIGGFYKRDSLRTFYQNFTREWVIRPMQSGELQRETSPEELREPELHQYYFDTVVWDNPFIDRIPVHSLTKDNFLLDENSGNNKALKSNTDKTKNAGIEMKLIPETYDSSPWPILYF
jgi:serine/threonine protein kinase